MPLSIRQLDPITDLDTVEALYAQASDYWRLADHAEPDRQKALDFFTDCPPDCDPAASHRLGLFQDGRLQGVAELGFGFPSPGDAYLGLMILAPTARSHGFGQVLLAEILRRAASAPRIYLGVLEANPRGRAFWERHGFQPTGISRVDEDTGNILHRLVKPL